MTVISRAIYIWHDGAATQTVRAKTKIVPIKRSQPKLSDFPEWGFDGSSTQQATGSDSDLILQPVFFCKDPLNQHDDAYLVLCEVFNPDGTTPHPTNKRAMLRRVMEHGGAACDPWIGFEQEYTLFKGSRPLGWPEQGYPAPQGPFYCGVGADEAFGRDFVEEHTEACLYANLMIAGTNAEVMPGQWEFQMGYRGDSSEAADPLTICDHMSVARWLLYRIGEKYGISATLENKPIKGEWNGAGQHTNFSTKATRDPRTGMEAIKAAIARLGQHHKEHIQFYGMGLEERLTGHHETSSMNRFSSGVADRGCSVRIPRAVANQGYGYFEDRRPGANANPYEISAVLLSAVCDITLP